MGLAVYEGKIYATSNDSKRIDIFLPNGKRLRSFYASAPEIPSQVMGTTVDWVGNIYVSDASNNSIKVFDDSGNYLYGFPRPLPGNAPDAPYISPIGLASKDKKIYAVDAADGTIKIYTTDSRFVAKFGGLGSGKGEFKYPNYLAFDDDGNLIVSDQGNNRVQILSPEGKFISFLESDKFKWLLPRGVAVDGYGRIHVVDNFAKKVRVFSKDKKYMFSYPKDTNDDAGELNFPNSIAVDKELRLIYLSDSGNNRVIVWGY